MKKLLLWTAGVLVLLSAGLAAAAWVMTYHPDAREPAPITCAGDAPLLAPGQTVKVLSWNVQYMAGKGHVFFYDVMGGEGPDDRPTRESIEATLPGVARVIREENPDIVLLQEIEQGSSRTDYEDQIARLLAELPADYRCHTSAYYWKADFVPHPRVMGAVGMKLAILSKYRLSRAVRHQLPEPPSDPITRLFSFKRAILEAGLPIAGAGAGAGRELVVLDTHLDAFAQGSDTMQRQVAMVSELLDRLSASGQPWLIGGDFNLLPPGAAAYERLKEHEKPAYLAETELRPLFERYQVVPGPAEIDGPDAALWFTHFPNDPRVGAPDRTIDYIFFSDDLTPGRRQVRQHDTAALSDHFPIVVELTLRP
jgi:endonuclease/exonuclease/phosphatase family metal-dependent hydrolase